MSSFCGTCSSTTRIFALNNVVTEPRIEFAFPSSKFKGSQRGNANKGEGEKRGEDKKDKKKKEKKRKEKKRKRRREKVRNRLHPPSIINFARIIIRPLPSRPSRFPPRGSEPLFAFLRPTRRRWHPIKHRRSIRKPFVIAVKLRADDLRFPPFRGQPPLILPSIIIGEGTIPILNSQRKQNSVTFSKLHRYATGKLIYFFARPRGGNEAVLSAGQNTSLSVSTRLRFISDPRSLREVKGKFMCQ